MAKTSLGKCGAMLELRESEAYLKAEQQSCSSHSLCIVHSQSSNHLHPRAETKTFPHDLSCKTQPQIMKMSFFGKLKNR
ncbi:hypothetical protein F7725_013086 [Dissostichus mawsoni]|uniref:Uncharacterized protein n=1 Tax=Dissostichus mawsoni TaxID=36200 RepID=A0A7J5YP36_DISMA|nr:hypothetical protein F7725_013086 [Dissostichus mawsoni]